MSVVEQNSKSTDAEQQETSTSTSTTTTSPSNSTNNNNNTTKTTEQILYGTWSLDNVKGNPPFARNSHKMVVYKDNLYVYGGNNKQEDQTGQLHMYTPETQTWYTLKEGPGRTLHSAVVYKDQLKVFGGSGKQEVRSLFRGTSFEPVLFNEVFDYTFATQQWTKYPTTGSFPLPRDGHSAVVHNETMYVFGGSDNTAVFCDLYALHLDRGVWMQARSEGTIPSPRRLHTCVVWDDCLWVFGGYDGKTSFNDVYMYDTATGTWSIPRTSGAIPHKRYGHTAVVYGDYMYIFGGYGAGSGFRNDLLYFHFPSGKWTMLSEKVAALSPRRCHAAEVLKDSMFVFGGGLTMGNYSDDMWVYKFNSEKVEEVQDTLTEDLQKMLDNPSFYPDVVFKVGSKKISAHKCILSARCSYFDSLFKSGFQEASSNELVIEDTDEEAFVVFLRYLYGGPVHLITPEVSFELLTMAERYLLPHLKWVCEGLILDGVSVENVVTLLITSDTYKCTRLYKACLDFISRNHQQVVKTEEFKTLPNTILLDVMAIISSIK